VLVECRVSAASAADCAVGAAESLLLSLGRSLQFLLMCLMLHCREPCVRASVTPIGSSHACVLCWLVLGSDRSPPTHARDAAPILMLLSSGSFSWRAACACARPALSFVLVVERHHTMYLC
jgi:hypothetical protein